MDQQLTIGQLTAYSGQEVKSKRQNTSMQLDQTTVPIQPRRATECIDVAVAFFGRHFPQMLYLWAHVALPSCILLYLITVQSEMDARFTLVVLYAATWLLGVLTIAGAARAVFGEPFDPQSTRCGLPIVLRFAFMAVDAAAIVPAAIVVGELAGDILGRALFRSGDSLLWPVLLLVVLSVRLLLVVGVCAKSCPGLLRALMVNGIRRAAMALGPLLLLFPLGTAAVLVGLLLSVVSLVAMLRMGFLSESIFLSRLDEQLHGRGVRELVRREGGDLFFRGCLIMLVTLLLAVIMFFTIDQACDLLLGFPILTGRLDQVLPGSAFGGDVFDRLLSSIGLAFTLLFSDARCLTVFTASALLVYPIARLAWFFCYIDLRVRRDCWDMELKFQQEARRLEATSA